jgi:hypothetical protein
MGMKLVGGDGWTLERAAPLPARAVRGSSSAGAGLPAAFLRPGVRVALRREARPNVSVRPGALAPLDIQVDGRPGERTIVVARHASGALTFHAPTDGEAPPRGSASPRALQFRIGVPPSPPAQRGLVGSAINLLVVKVKEALIDEAVRLGARAASRAAETLWWKRRKLREGWCALEGRTGRLSLRHLDRVDPGAGRALLFLHGTFSDTAGSFAGLLQPAFLSELQGRYGGRVFGFEHFTVSRSLEENVRALVEALPERETVFDVVSYSRGGLVLRMLAELPQQFGALGRRFRLGEGVLVATPNRGTPLATGERWEHTVGLVANLLEALPDNPWTMAAHFVADGIVWLAAHLTGDLPGLAAMDAGGETIGALQEGRGPAAGAYSALGTNFNPDASLWRRLVDAGIDGFFDGANDLVVPTAGAWQVDAAIPAVVPAERVASFGLDGNLRPQDGTVHHLNTLAQPETARFIRNALWGTPQGLSAIDLSRPPRTQQVWRGAGAQRSWERPPAGARPSTDAVARAGRAPDVVRAVGGDLLHGSVDADRTLHLVILGEAGAARTAQILATYGSARIVEPFVLRNNKGARGDEAVAGSRFQTIIRIHERIRMSLDGRPDRNGRVPALPNDDELRAFGTALFDALFVGGVRRLYDLARADQRGDPLNVVFTCAIPWVAAKPWEFAFDPTRRKFLATEEVHFIRNVLTSVPAQRIGPRPAPLRLLIVEAQPVGTAILSVEDEQERIRHRFRPLLDAKLVEIDVVAEATPERLHEQVFASWIEGRTYDVVHFIGHGDFDRQAEQGRLLFVSSDGGAQLVGVQTLREILCGRGIQLVFLNACETAEDANRQLNRGVAQALVQGGLPAVVANQYPVLDPSAVTFAQYFYWALAHGGSIGEAAREARIAVNYSREGELIDWAVPVVYAREPDYRLCARLTRLAPMSRAPVVSEERPAAAGSKQPPRRAAPAQVGVADLARFFPGLAQVLERLNGVQDRFAFREVEISAPLGVWVREEGRSYLHAERLAEKLRDEPRSLGVDFLACVTNWWMRDEESLNIYGWWSGDRSLPILIVSTAGLALPAEGPVAGRALANEVVAGLAAQMLAYESSADAVHERGPSDCPLFDDPERAIESVSGRRRFDPRCRKRLATTLGRATVSAFDDLLAAFAPESGKAPRPSRGLVGE